MDTEWIYVQILLVVSLMIQQISSTKMCFLAEDFIPSFRKIADDDNPTWFILVLQKIEHESAKATLWTIQFWIGDLTNR